MFRVASVRVVLTQEGELVAVTGLMVRMLTEEKPRPLLGESRPGERWIPADEILLG